MLWNPWRGCHRTSEGCLHCYIHKGDIKRGTDTNVITKTKDFYKPVERNKNGEYKIKSGTLVYVCFSSDFFLEEADDWRMECYEMMKERNDLHFLFLTKRISRFYEVLPLDWKDGYDNITIGVSIENQKNADEKLSFFNSLPIKHKHIDCQPLIESINIEKYLDNIELVLVGGESDVSARPLDFVWVLDIRNQCIKQDTTFVFRQCGTHFIKDGIQYTIPTRQLMAQARKANIDYISKKIDVNPSTVD